MSHIIKVRNVEAALGEGFQWLKVAGVDEPSRNGPVRVAPGPVITEYACPRERVLFNAERDANPIFHLLESIWMLAGSDDSKFLIPYNARMAEYAEPDGMVHGAYGYRWRNLFGIDQILQVVQMLKEQPHTRRAVLGMWSPAADLNEDKRDLPCNTHIYFGIQDGELNMTVCCRSNDILWGAYGANAVHFSMLQELIALGVGAQVGTYYQFSNNFHVYTDLPIVQKWLDAPPFKETSGYKHKIIPMLIAGESVEDFLTDCLTMVRDAQAGWKTVFFFRVASVLKDAYDVRKWGGTAWRGIAGRAEDCDWKDAFLAWAERRVQTVEAT